MSTWREKYNVHPADNIFPMMSDEELQKLGESIRTNGLKQPIILFGKPKDVPTVLDGRNRLEAMERVGLEPKACQLQYTEEDPVAFVISANIIRRHLTKQQQADLIVAAVKGEEKPGQAGPVSGLTDFGDQLVDGINELVDRVAGGSPHIKGGRGKRNPIKEKALAINAALPKEQQVSERTIKRAIAKAEGKTPAAKQYTARPMPKPRSGKPVVGIDAVRQCYLDRCAEPDVDLDSEQEIVIDALREIAGKRAMQAQADDDLGDIPEGLNRRRQGGAP